MVRTPLAIAILVAATLAAGTEAKAYVCGSRYLVENPERACLPLGKPVHTVKSAADIQVGTRLDFPVATQVLLRSATCRQRGDHCYVFVEDGQWDTDGGPILQRDVDGLVNLFEKSTPADPDRGIRALADETLGPPPDVDNDPRIFILLLNLTDPNLVGFFDSRVATWPDPALRRDVICLDTGFLYTNSNLVRGTLAHEYQHLVQWGHDPDEETWINEGLSGYAEELAGYPEADPAMVPAFLAYPELNLTLWPSRATSANYGETYLYASFMAERYGREFIRALVSEPRNGIAGIEGALAAVGKARSFQATWEDWLVGNCAGSDPVLGYTALRGRTAATIEAPDLPFVHLGAGLNYQWGALNVLFRHRGALSTDLEAEAAGLFTLLGYAHQGGAGTRVDGVVDADGSVRLTTTQVDSLVLIVGRVAPQGTQFWLSARPVVPTWVTGADLPARPVQLGAAYPNPFNGQIQVPFTLDAASPVQVAVLDGLGRQVRQLAAGYWPAGAHHLTWDGCDDRGHAVASGTYLVCLTLGPRRQTVRLTLAR